MQRSLLRRVLAASLVLSLMAGAATSSTLVGQEKEGKSTKPAAKAKGRLPAYYKDVVTEKQRADIYAIQRKYADQIEALQAQLKALNVERDAEIETVLTAEQKAKLDKLRADAASKRKPKPDAAESTVETTAEAVKPATTAATRPTSSRPAGK